MFVEWREYKSSSVKNPCPTYLQKYSAPNADGGGAMTCFMWEPTVRDAFLALVKSAAAKYDSNANVEGMIFQESALGFSGTYSQAVSAGGTYTPELWRDALIQFVDQCGKSFAKSRCMSFLNFLEGKQAYLNDISAAISAVPNNRACFSGPDLLPNNKSLFATNPDSVYQVLVKHQGCRSDSAQNDSFNVPDCDLECIFKFAVSGIFGSFPTSNPLSGGVCVNSYLFWNHLIAKSSTGLNWTDAVPTINSHPYGAGWYGQCAGGGGAP
jgi:hypothetical protein